MMFRNLRIEKNDDGTFQVEASYEKKPSKKNEPYGYEEKKYGCADIDECAATVKKILSSAKTSGSKEELKSWAGGMDMDD